MKVETTFQKIMRKTGKKPIECKCKACKRQCQSICLGTPEDIERIIDAGYKERLVGTEWCVAMIMGVYPLPISMIQAKQTEQGCTFFKDGLCELHSKGLKPTEGKLSHHTTTLENFKFSKSLAWNVAKEWLDVENLPIIERIVEKMGIKAKVGLKVLDHGIFK